MSSVTGVCFCGDVRYAIEGEPKALGICHCESCRRIAGAESVAWAVIPQDAFSVTAGEPTTFRSSANVTRMHCARCGTCLTYRVDDRAFIDVTLGSLDDPETWIPKNETFREEAVSWNALSPDTSHFAAGSAGPQLSTD